MCGDRHRIEHGGLIRPDQVERLRRLDADPMSVATFLGDAVHDPGQLLESV